MATLESHKEENRWKVNLTENETAQLYVNGSPFGPLYTVGVGREAKMLLAVNEQDIQT